MWIWWGATVGICAWKIAEGFWRPHRMLEWPFLACAMWAYFYGYMAYEAKISLPAYLGNGIANLGQLMPLLCLVGILVGWTWGTRVKGRRSPEKRVYPYFRFWLAGSFFLMLGAAGGFSVLRAVESGNFSFEESSGYWYLLFYVGYPGLAMSVWALFKMDPVMRKYLGIITVLGLAAFMFPHLSGARRGPLFPAIMILLLVPSLATRRSPNPLIFFGCLAAAGLSMLLFLQIRNITYNGGTWGEAIHNLSLNVALEERAQQPEDNEYINNCQIIGTIYQNGKYQYGTGYLELLYHWIPRAVWKDKPALGEGYYSFDEMFDDVESATGYRLLGSGAAVGGVADAFVQFGVFCPLFWLALSWGMGIVYARARMGNGPLWLFCYVGFICASHWLVSQGFSPAFVPGMCFQAVPLVVFMLLGNDPKREAIALKGRRRPAHFQAPKRAAPSQEKASAYETFRGICKDRTN